MIVVPMSGPESGSFHRPQIDQANLKVRTTTFFPFCYTRFNHAEPCSAGSKYVLVINKVMHNLNIILYNQKERIVNASVNFHDCNKRKHKM